MIAGEDGKGQHCRRTCGRHAVVSPEPNDGYLFRYRYNAGLFCNHPSGTWVTYDAQVDFTCNPSQCGGLDGRKAFFTGGAQVGWHVLLLAIVD